MPTTIRNGPDKPEWDCVEPSSLENELATNDSEAPACPAGKVPTASARMPLRKKARLAFDAVKQMFGFVGDVRQSRPK